MSETQLNACWNSIGNFGDKTCPELPKHVRCLNCAVYRNAAATLLNRKTPEGYLEFWTERIAGPRQVKPAGTRSIVIFRINQEWLALPTEVFLEVVELRPIHTLPHRQDALVRGLTMVRGELLICIALPHLLGFEAPPSHAANDRKSGRSVYERLLVIGQNGERVVFSVNEVHVGVRYHSDELNLVPATVAQSSTPYTCGLLTWENRTVGVLDENLLFYALRRRL
ncbi:MAG: chemotaxis protein CheW [Verrucomicrobia bacterium]|nr:chemotaxis protein CheW [Verrucomicrobiota bacterium]